AASALGAVMAGAFFLPYLSGVELGHEHGPEAVEFPARLWELLLETSVPLLVGVIGAALIEAWLPGSVASWLTRGSRLRQALMGVAVGAPMPVCSCGVLPIYRSLMLRGVSPSAGLALLIAAPEIGVDSFLLSFAMLGTGTTMARLSCALLLALSVGWIVGRLAEAAPVRGGERDHDHDHARPSGLWALRRGLLETWGHLAPWILFGLLVTALVEPWISVAWADALPAWLQVVLLALAGMPTYICATAATPFAALLLAKGFTPGAVIAFLLVGPATNLTTFGALRRLHSRQVALAFVLVALGSTLLLGWGVDALAGPLGIGVGPAVAPAGEEHAHGALQLVAAALLGLLTLWVLVREGPRSLLAQLWPEGSAGRTGGHDHAHDHA
ncbi:MAG TPA: permease, partial [Planctomycetota bacterium]|nr:permease [Planctomycetota bacterium]